ncbi:hypothetical protein EMIHUDRAFT_219907 [Emiliania huxleyi CCMP1516]|uniref:Uncharacterized protein n=2 Tax=Emiliania huxleyi TaxID=2903 RepID=A0A0D3I3G6_EMIH1|nr:hypothetical protein EMIHUDRAFT_219907 [Emiliania huxleyi CCMP1516]EOD05801.1 hypothetical protein EMIHUDRAFT_219907 [Emiliania huxleyi CCMP1516]|eukprot:XP_005758230.1 hypothetical protein EMIHUDRAFT_219907 [Emiliania huxleyi CCMP1516]
MTEAARLGAARAAGRRRHQARGPAFRAEDTREVRLNCERTANEPQYLFFGSAGLYSPWLGGPAHSAFMEYMRKNHAKYAKA